jgi:hypothetical protein
VTLRTTSSAGLRQMGQATVVMLMTTWSQKKVNV